MRLAIILAWKIIVATSNPEGQFALVAAKRRRSVGAADAYSLSGSHDFARFARSWRRIEYPQRRCGGNIT
jgi:hypothetical protein